MKSQLENWQVSVLRALIACFSTNTSFNSPSYEKKLETKIRIFKTDNPGS